MSVLDRFDGDIIRALRFQDDEILEIAADEIERLREEVQELEQIMEENNCAVGYLIAKRALKQNGMWKQKDSE